MDSPTTLIFIGNGFDIEAGYPTKYKDFYESDQFKSLIDGKDAANTNQIAKYIKLKQAL